MPERKRRQPNQDELVRRELKKLFPGTKVKKGKQRWTVDFLPKKGTNGI